MEEDHESFSFEADLFICESYDDFIAFDDENYEESLQINDPVQAVDGFGGEMDCTKESVVGADFTEYEHAAYESPGGSKFWVPRVEDSLEIDVGSVYPTLESAEAAYRKYAEAAGFDVRRSNMKKNSVGDVQNRYLLCSKEGIPCNKNFDSLGISNGNHKMRNSNVKRSGCKACVKFRLMKEGKQYVVYKFESKHNHPLFNKQDKSLARSKRQLQYTDYRAIYNASSACIGGSKSHMIQSAIKGGYEFMGATSVDYENARRDMVRFVGRKDAQMLVNLLTNRKLAVPDFFFEYMCRGRELHAIFWADEIARLNFQAFGDTVSFDATYRMNRHAMIFIPFIAIDNRKKSVVVGSALVSHESVDNFKWVLEAFKKAHGKQPVFVITDQCAAMKKAIPQVFDVAKHKLCMWHIMKKLPSKISGELDANVTFKRRFNKLVWNTHIEPEAFEEEWNAIIEEHQLHDNGWLAEMFEIRQSWIPAYYKDIPMSGLMRTTSRSESSHAFFRIFASYRNDLVKFLHAFDGAIEKQRNKHRILEFITRNTLPRCATPLLIERNASEIYTRTVFFEVRKEIRKATLFCGLKELPDDGDSKRYLVTHKNRKSVTKLSYVVVQNTIDGTMNCECNLYSRNGILCRHMFKVLLNDDVHSIPVNLVQRRWTRALIPVEIQAARARYGEVDIEKEKVINGLYNKVDLLVSRLRNDISKLESVGATIDKLIHDHDVQNYVTCPAKDKAEALKECYGVEPPEKVVVIPPLGIRNKGCGTGKRLVGALEKATIKGKRPKRMCKRCNSFANHDSRNCPLKSRG